MTNHEIGRHLRGLVQLDYDAIRAYRQAVEQIDVPDVRDQLTIFENDHARHVQNLSQIIRRLGENPPEMKPDIKGFLIEGFTAVRSLTGTEGALKAMHANEKLVGKRYKEATQVNLPADIKAQVELNYRDEQRHTRFIEEKLTEKSWVGKA